VIGRNARDSRDGSLRRMRPLSIRAIGLGLAVCGALGCECADARSVTDAGPISRPEPEPAVLAPPATSTAPAPRRWSRAEHQTFRREVREARLLTSTGAHREALAHYERALEALPSARLRCEAGWSAYRGGDLDRAERYVRDALRKLPDVDHVPDAMRVPLAMCLYNAARILEDRGDLASSERALVGSLALRPDATVSARLTAVRAEIAAQPTSEPPSDDAPWMDRVRERFCAARSGTDLRCDARALAEEGIEEEVLEAGGEVPAAGHDALDARLVVLGDYSLRQLWLVASDPTSVAVLQLAEGQREGADYGSSRSFDVGEVVFEDVVSGGAPELVVRWRETSEYLDTFTCEGFGSEIAVLLVCSRDSGALVCGRLPIERSAWTGGASDCTVEEAAGGNEERWGEDWAAEWSDAPRAEHGYALEATTSRGRIEVAAAVPDPDAPALAPDEADRAAVRALVGAHDPLELIKREPFCIVGCGP
jgi:hypothetical protein